MALERMSTKSTKPATPELSGVLCQTAIALIRGRATCCGEGRPNGFPERRFKNVDILFDGATAYADTRDQRKRQPVIWRVLTALRRGLQYSSRKQAGPWSVSFLMSVARKGNSDSLIRCLRMMRRTCACDHLQGARHEHR
jgi:hypothetical protein